MQWTSCSTTIYLHLLKRALPPSWDIRFGSIPVWVIHSLGFHPLKHTLPPLAGLLHPSTMLSSAFNSDLNDISLDIDAGVRPTAARRCALAAEWRQC
ncbi:hypothetical protein BLNAU_23147 [Blattamonas nauphoetae]|uniref:Uncharacterized protein n=1 Tax=Blattamonas nauphoetae TaxID=2049346 RepID=A0ABQ9WR28_9EUKA|nr:hypothetical protein BLNAU_23147 [Blattamonas nauphoetae]